MKIGVVSDTHMPWRGKRLPEALREGLAGVDLILHAGDWETIEVYEELSRIAPVEGVAGNVDGPEIAARFGRRKLLELEGLRIGIVHGHEGKGRTTPERALHAFDGEQPDLIVFGHSHMPLLRQEGGTVLFNPGSPTDKRRQPRYSFGLIVLRDGEVRAEHRFFDDKPHRTDGSETGRERT